MAALSRRALLTRISPTRSRSREPWDRTWLRVHRTAMACRVEVVVSDSSPAALASARAALDEADRLEAMLTVFRDTSDLVRVNRQAADGAVTVPRELYEVLDRSLALHRATERAFDISSTPLSRCWGFLRREGRLPLPSELDAARASVDLESMVLDPESSSVFLRRRGVELNLGAIGKGYVLDRMASLLRGSGVGEALISAGRSSIVALGAPAKGLAPSQGDGWRIDLCSMAGHDVVGRVVLRDGALGTSGAGEQFFEVNGVQYGHVIDPRSGWPASGVRAASVVASRAADADALSTAFLVGGVDVARRYCASHRDVLAVVTPDAGPPQVFGRYDGAVVELADA